MTGGQPISAMDETAADPPRSPRPYDLVAVRVFLLALAILLAGYMFMGRGFAHLGMRPIYVGEVVLFLGLLCTGIAVVRLRLRFAPSKIVWLLLGFMALGAARTVPYLGVNGVDALRDAVLWGYAVFALMIYVLADRPLILGAFRLYGWVVPVFALWLPISWNIFVIAYQGLDPNKLGSFHPLVFFKSGDMAVHVAGSIAFLVLGTGTVAIARRFLWRVVIALPLTWTTFLTATQSRGALLASLAGYGTVFLFAPRSRNWAPILVATVVLVVGLTAPGPLGRLGQQLPDPSPIPSGIATPIPSGIAPPIPSGIAPPIPSGIATAPPVVAGPVATPLATPDGRSQDVGQLIVNITSVFVTSSIGALDGTRAFRLAWWGKIVDYTVFGPYFWSGKGFGVNLADDDGFQPTADGSLRAPHNSHMTALARMGVPGFVLWLLLQGAFSIGLLRSTLAHRRTGDTKVAAVGAWILVYWAATMVNTSFDPYLEGPQGGIWFWTLFGLGLAIIRLTPRQRAA